jgi:hypothetical protein
LARTDTSAGNKFALELDSSTGSPTPNDVDPNSMGFGFYIMTGKQNEMLLLICTVSKAF